MRKAAHPVTEPRHCPLHAVASALKVHRRFADTPRPVGEQAQRDNDQHQAAYPAPSEGSQGISATGVPPGRDGKVGDQDVEQPPRREPQPGEGLETRYGVHGPACSVGR